MLMFRIEPYAPFLDTIPVLSHLGQKAKIKSSESMFTLMVSDPTHRFTAALQILPEFFEYFNSNQTHHSRFSIEKFYLTMFHMELRGYSSMLFILIQAINKISLAFENPQSRTYPFLVIFIAK